MEALEFNRKKNGLGYEKDLNFHILDYSKPIQFVSIRVLAKDFKGKDSNVPEVDKGVNDDSNNIVDKVDKHIDKIVSASNVIKLATWKQIALISILFSIVGRQIIFQRNAERRRFKNEQFIMVGWALGSGI